MAKITVECPYKVGDWLVGGFNRSEKIKILAIKNGKIIDSYYAQKIGSKKALPLSNEELLTEWKKCAAPHKFNEKKFELKGKKIIAFKWQKYKDITKIYYQDNKTKEITISDDLNFPEMY